MIEREFAGEIRQFQLLPADRFNLYSGLEKDIGGVNQLAVRVATRELLSASDTFHIISHALSGGHPIGLIKVRELVKKEMSDKPLQWFQPLVIDIVTDLYAGPDNDDQIPEPS